jgi:hypothetical protein
MKRLRDMRAGRSHSDSAVWHKVFRVLSKHVRWSAHPPTVTATPKSNIQIIQYCAFILQFVTSEHFIKMSGLERRELKLFQRRRNEPKLRARTASTHAHRDAG